MTEDQLQIMRDAIAQAVAVAVPPAIQLTVNGKIDKLNNKFDIHALKHEEDMEKINEHMREVQPYLDGARGVKVFGTFAKWSLGIGIAWATFTGNLPKL